MSKPLCFPRFQALKDDGSFAVGWKVQTYSAGTTTPLASYADQGLATANANPVILDGTGSAEIWLDPAQAYKVVLTDDSDVVQWTVDKIQTADALTGTTLSVSGQITSTLATGTAPFAVTSTTKNTNLNADLLDGADWASPASLGSTEPNAVAATTLSASGAATLASTLAVTGAATFLSSILSQTANGAVATLGNASESLTLSTSGTTTDTTANLLPANSLILAVVARVTTTITTATDWKLGDSTTAARFTAANSTLAAGTTDVGLAHLKGGVSTDAAGPTQSAAAKVRVTTTGTPGAGVIRITVYYITFTPPTS